MSGWGGYALAWAAFLATHFVPARPALRERLVAALGRRPWFSLYGLVSLAVTAWLIGAAGRAPFVELWPQLPWTRWVPNLVLPAAVALAALGLPARTVTLGGPRTPRALDGPPGIAAITRHPLLWALALWSLSHLAPNGDLAHVLLFGGFAALAFAGMAAFDARARAALGPAAPAYFAAHPLLALRPTRWPPGAGRRLLAALAVWIAALLLHPWVIGVPPLPV